MQYYLGRYLPQLGTLFSVTVFSLLLSTGGFYVTGALGGQWAVAEKYLVLASLSGLLLPWAWLTDSLQLGAGRTGTTMVIMLVEQALRLGLMWLFVQRFQFMGIYLAAKRARPQVRLLAWSVNHPDDRPAAGLAAQLCCSLRRWRRPVTLPALAPSPGCSARWACTIRTSR